MKVVILAGGKGSRLAEHTSAIPKPMVKILGVPIIVRIINFYKKFGFKEFIIASGYKSQIIKKYFESNMKELNINVVFTGKNTMTGGRIKRLEKLLNKERFLLTYGDGLFLLVLGGVGMVVPTPGGIGSYHAIVMIGLSVLGVGTIFLGEGGDSSNPALLFPTIMHAAQTLVAIIMGSISLLILFLSKKNAKS